MKWKPHKYQQKAIKFCVSRQNAGLLLSPGLGKTSILLAVFKILKSQGFVNSLLVLAPLRAVYSVWPKEVHKWDEFKGLTVGVLHGPDKLETLKRKCDIYLINYEGLQWLRDQGLPKHIDMLAADESSKLKNPQTQRYKLLRTMLGNFKHRYILTGSFAARSLMDIFGQCFVMDMGASLGPYVTHFRSTYFNSVGYGGYEYELKPGAAEKIYARVAPRTIQMSAEDYLELPELIIRDIFIDLPEKVMRVYKQMETRLRIDIDKGIVSAANAAVASGKCRQIANGGVYIDGENWENLHDEKTTAVMDLVEELQGQPALIAYEFKHDLDRLKQVLGKDTPHIGSGVSVTLGKKYEEQWNRGELRCLLGHPQSMAHALNLQGCELGSATIFHSLPWSYELYDQYIRRSWRQGRGKRVVVHRLVARGTIDELIVKSLEQKEVGQNKLFKALKEYLNPA